MAGQMTNRLRVSFCLSIFSVFFLQLVLPLPASADENRLPGNLISPQTGAICNRKVKVCYDSFGVSIGITKDVMGEQAADKLTRELSAVDEANFDRTNFNHTRPNHPDGLRA